MDANTAGIEHTRVRRLKQPQQDASKIEMTRKLCLSTEPYTFSRSFLRLSSSLPLKRLPGDSAGSSDA